MRDCKRAKNPTGVAHSPLLLQAMPHRLVATHIPFVIIRTPRSMKKIGPILRAQDKASTQESVNAPAPPAENAAAVPPGLAPTQVAKGSVAPLPAAKPAPASTPNEVAIEQATRKLRDRVDQLEAELQKSRTQMSAAENEKQSLNSRLDETKSKLGKAQGDLDKAKTAEKQVRDQLTQAQASLKKTAAAGSNEGKAQEALRSEIGQLKKALVSAQEGRGAAEKERDDANTKVAGADQQRASASKERDEANARAAAADQKVASANKERDDALTQLKGLKDTEQRVEVLVSENSNLKQKLARSEEHTSELQSLA